MTKTITRKKVPSKKKAAKKQTYIALVIDRSGSMNGKEKSVVDGVNEQLNAKVTDDDLPF